MRSYMEATTGAGGDMNVVLFSGGLDSTVMLAELLACGERCETLTFHYGQKHSIETWKARLISDWYGVRNKLVLLPGLAGSALTDRGADVPSGVAKTVDTTYVPGRNLLFLAYAASYAEANTVGPVYIGSCRDDWAAYPDCRPEFFNAVSKAVPVQIVTPNLERSKQDIVVLARELDVPIGMTWSCYNPNSNNPCGVCGACELRARALR